jgi:hypothetical protein
MPEITIVRNNFDLLAAKLKADLEASNAKLNADLEAMASKIAPSASAATRDIARGRRRIRRSPNFRRLAALVSGCLLIVGIAFITVHWAGNWDRAPVAKSEIAIPPPLGTMKRMDAIRDSFTKH